MSIFIALINEQLDININAGGAVAPEETKMLNV